MPASDPARAGPDSRTDRRPGCRPRSRSAPWRAASCRWRRAPPAAACPDTPAKVPTPSVQGVAVRSSVVPRACSWSRSSRATPPPLVTAMRPLTVSTTVPGRRRQAVEQLGGPALREARPGRASPELATLQHRLPCGPAVALRRPRSSASSCAIRTLPAASMRQRRAKRRAATDLPYAGPVRHDSGHQDSTRARQPPRATHRDHGPAARRAASFRSPDYVAGVRDGDRTVLARAITLIESARPEHQAQAQALLVELLPHAGQAQRIGITGVPGVGKSTFIDAFGTLLTGRDTGSRCSRSIRRARAPAARSSATRREWSTSRLIPTPMSGLRRPAARSAASRG